VRCPDQTQLVVRYPNWFIGHFLFSLPHTSNFFLCWIFVESSSLMTLHRLASTSFTSSLSQLFKLKSGLLITSQLLKTLVTILEELHVASALKTLSTQALAYRRTTFAETNGCAWAPPVVGILSESICSVHFEVLHSATMSTSFVWVSRSLDNPVLVDCTCSHLRDFRNQS